MAKHQVTAQELRDIVEAIIAPGIGIHRKARNARGHTSDYFDDERPSDEEIDAFIATNTFLDEDLKSQLTDEGLLGFPSRIGSATAQAVDEFRRSVGQWAASREWLDAQVFGLPNEPHHAPTESLLWVPPSHVRPGWVDASCSYLLVAAELLRRGRLLSELTPREFEFVVGELLEHDGWHVEVGRGTRDGGVDVVATRSDPTLGDVRTLWQAKKYAPGNNVRLSQVRELAAVLERERASKALIITTSHLTKDALAWIRKDTYRLSAKDRPSVERWVLQAAGFEVTH
jgi:hypothetical protein